jgi:hypothetical protein
MLLPQLALRPVYRWGLSLSCNARTYASVRQPAGLRSVRKVVDIETDVSSTNLVVHTKALRGCYHRYYVRRGCRANELGLARTATSHQH